MSFLSNLFQPGAYKEPSTGMEFPETIDAYERGRITPYKIELGKAGVMIEYRSLGEGAEATVQIRALGNDAEKTSEYFLNDYFRIKKYLQAIGEDTDLQIYNSKPENEKPCWKSAMFTENKPNRFVVSFIFFKVTATHLLEIHGTTNNSNIESTKSFIQSLQEIMDKPTAKL